MCLTDFICIRNGAGRNNLSIAKHLPSRMPYCSAPEVSIISQHLKPGSASGAILWRGTLPKQPLPPFFLNQVQANGAAVIVAPGGGFRWLSMGNEGWEVAQALADKGIAAFVLKYRLHPTPESLDDFKAWMNRPRTTPPANSDTSKTATPPPRSTDGFV